MDCRVLVGGFWASLFKTSTLSECDTFVEEFEPSGKIASRISDHVVASLG